MIICLEKMEQKLLYSYVKFIFLKHVFSEILTALVCYQLFQL